MGVHLCAVVNISATSRLSNGFLEPQLGDDFHNVLFGSPKKWVFDLVRGAQYLAEQFRESG
jgi:hypothetical protein